MFSWCLRLKQPEPDISPQKSAGADKQQIPAVALVPSYRRTYQKPLIRATCAHAGVSLCHVGCFCLIKPVCSLAGGNATFPISLTFSLPGSSKPAWTPFSISLDITQRPGELTGTDGAPVLILPQALKFSQPCTTLTPRLLNQDNIEPSEVQVDILSIFFNKQKLKSKNIHFHIRKRKAAGLRPVRSAVIKMTTQLSMQVTANFMLTDACMRQLIVMLRQKQPFIIKTL